MDYPRYVDWFLIVTDLERSGLTQREIAKCVGVAKSTINSWKYRCEPGFSNGNLLLDLWSERTHKAVRDAPVKVC
ncbi:TPA: helix-turn-helix transcriptional regulator [Salmonella enterica]|nr:helix-turn-helix transcriptional regulator [Salmonella enterica]